MASLLKLQNSFLLAERLCYALLDWLKAAQFLQILPDSWRKHLLQYMCFLATRQLIDVHQSMWVPMQTVVGI